MRGGAAASPARRGIIGGMRIRHVVRPPSCEPGAPDPRIATGPPVRWGVVATGHIARTVTEQLLQLEDAVLQAVSSRSEGSARAFADAFGAAAAYADRGDEPGYLRLARDPDVDVVYVATPHAQHHRVARVLLEAGKHVLLEKAFTVTAAEADDLVRAARERGCFLMEAVWTRFLPVYHALLDHLERDAIGAPRWVQADLGMAVAFDPDSRLWARAAGGGALLDLSIYPLTWALAALGLPSDVQAAAEQAENGVDALTTLALRHPSGGHAQVVTSLVAQAASTATIGGSEGIIRTLAPLPNPPGFDITRDGAEQRVRIDASTPRYAYQLREVNRCLQEGLMESPTMPLADTLALMRLLDAARAQIGVRYPNDDAAFAAPA